MQNQLSFFSGWISGDDAMPKDGESNIHYYEDEHGNMRGPIAGDAMYIDGKYFYRKIFM